MGLYNKMSEKHKDNTIRASVIGAVIGGIFTIAAAIIGLQNYNQFNQVEVPDVIGYSVASATKMIAESQLQYIINNDNDNDELDENDIIIGQSIDPGIYVSKGTTLILTVNQDSPAPPCENHIAGQVSSIDSAHPHYKWYICEICGEKFTLGETNEVSACETCFPPSSSSSTNQPGGLQQAPSKSSSGSSGQNSSGSTSNRSGSDSDDSGPGDPSGSSSESQPDGSSQISEPLPPEPEDFSVDISHMVIPEYLQFTDENVRITATTSHKATAVELVVEPAAYGQKYNMHSDNQTDWTFKACFDVAGTYTVTAVAYFGDSITATDSFTITYPFN